MKFSPVALLSVLLLLLHGPGGGEAFVIVPCSSRSNDAGVGGGWCLPPPTTSSIDTSSSSLRLSATPPPPPPPGGSSDSSSSGSSSGSRLEGNRRQPTAQEFAIMDEMIEKMSNAPAFELPGAVRSALRVVSSPQFFLRIAHLAEQPSSSAKDKARLAAFSENLVSTLETVVNSAEDRMEERSLQLEGILKQAAEPETGEFLWPLTSQQLAGMRQALAKMDPQDLDEGFLSIVDAWMNKSMQDGMDGMVGILQKLLQQYAGLTIARERMGGKAAAAAAADSDSDSDSNEEEASSDEMNMNDKKNSSQQLLLHDLLEMDTELWEATLRQKQELDPAQVKSLLGEVQRTMESVVLGMESGSISQRVLAEYLKELVTRIEAVVEKGNSGANK